VIGAVATDVFLADGLNHFELKWGMVVVGNEDKASLRGIRRIEMEFNMFTPY